MKSLLLIPLLVLGLNCQNFDGQLTPEVEYQNQFLASSDDQGRDAEIVPVSKPLGQVTGLDFDVNKNLVIFHRGDRVWTETSFNEANVLDSDLDVIRNSTIYVVDRASGRVISEHGESLFYMPHGLTIDNYGNVFVTDVGSHQVVKLDAAYRPIFTLGEKLVPGSDDYHFCQPTDVAVAKNGDFFVADGYCNSRIVKFNVNGTFLEEFNPSNEGNFLPHSIALIEDMDMICVADRDNQKIVCFTAGLKKGHRALPMGLFVTKADDIGRVYAIREKEHYLVGVTSPAESDNLEPQLFAIDINSGRATTFAKGLDGHSLAVDEKGDIYVGRTDSGQVVHINHV